MCERKYQQNFTIRSEQHGLRNFLSKLCYPLFFFSSLRIEKLIQVSEAQDFSWV